MRPDDDAAAAEIALKKRWIDAPTLRRALEIQAEAAALGLEEDLLDILVSKGFVSERLATEFEDDFALRRLAHPTQAEAIAGYRILERVGRSGIGVLFRATQLSMERVVALKVLPPELARDKSFAMRFRRETRMVAQVNHPRLACGLDSGRSADFHYYAREFPSGRSLAEALRDGPLRPRAVLGIAADMAGALAHLESLHLVHRGIEPACMIQTPDAGTVLSGLGVARHPEDPSVTLTGISPAMPHYSAPEVAAGAAGVDIRADIFSLGATLYHALAGTPPAAPGSDASTARPDASGDLAALVARMMAPAPDDRFQTPADLSRALQRVRTAAATQPATAKATKPLPIIAPPKSQEPTAPGAPPLPAIAPAAKPPPLGPPPARAGRAAQVGWIVAFALLVGVLAVSVVWAVRSRLGRTGAQPQARPMGPAPTTNVAATPVPAAPSPPAAAPAQALAAAAIEFEKGHPKAHAEALLALRRALLEAPEPNDARRLRLRIVARQQVLTEAASSEHAKRIRQADELRKQDRPGEALRVLAGYPEELRCGPWAERLATEMTNLCLLADQRYATLANDGREALARQSFTKALGGFKRIGDLGVPWMANAGAALLASAQPYVEAEQKRLAELERRKAVAQRRRSLGRLSTPVAAVAAQLKKRDYAQALALCKAIPEAVRRGDAAAVVADLEERIAVLAQLWDAVEKGPAAAVGQTLTLYAQPGAIAGFRGKPGARLLILRIKTRSGEKTLSQPIARLPASELGRLAAWACAGEPAQTTALKLGLLYLAEGEAGKARARLLEAQKLGVQKADGYLEELEAAVHVGGALTTVKQGKRTEARGLLETCLDRFGATLPVILRHAELTKALAACPPKPGDTKVAASPRPLPTGLQRLLLLPETRVSSASAGDPLAAQFATPLVRQSPVLVGLDDWGDYSLSLRWTPHQGSRVVLAGRVVEFRRGQFACYYVAVDGADVVLGLRAGGADKQLAKGKRPELRGRKHQRLIFTLAGSKLSVVVNGEPCLQATDTTLQQGRAALITPNSQALVHQLWAYPSGKARRSSRK